jgi:hypothetical protein
MARNEELIRFQGLAEHAVGLGLRSKAATIRRLAPDIASYLELGYSLSQLLDVFLQAGLAPTPLSTFKSVLARWRASSLEDQMRPPGRSGNAVTFEGPEK